MKTRTIKDIPVKDIKLVANNPRGTIADKDVEDLKSSISLKGILTPLHVRFSVPDGVFYLIAGHRRLKVAELLKLSTVPAEVLDCDEKEAFEIMIIDNLQRVDIHPYDEAYALVELYNIQLDFNKVAVLIGKSKSFVAKRIKLTSLNKKMAEMFLSNKIGLGPAQVICLLSGTDQEEVLKWMNKNKEEWPLSTNKVIGFIENQITLDLTKALFDIEDKGLNVKAGPCIGCPKNTASNTLIFDVLTKDSKCVDSGCFNGKVKTHLDNKRTALVSKHDEKKVVDISSSYYDMKNGVLPNDEYNSLAKDNYNSKERSKDCEYTKIGFFVHTAAYDTEKLGKSVRICTAGKKCKIHYDGYTPSSGSTSREMIPEDETLIEGTERKLKKRRVKQKNSDIKSARINLMDIISDTKSKELNDYELDELCRGVFSHFSNGQIDILYNMDIKKKKDNEIVKEHGEYGGWYDVENFAKIKPLLKTRQDKWMFIRSMIAGHALDHYTDTPTMGASDDLIKHAESLKHDIKPLFKVHQEKRKEKYSEENTKLKNMKEKDANKGANAKEIVKEAINKLDWSKKDKEDGNVGLVSIHGMNFVPDWLCAASLKDFTKRTPNDDQLKALGQKLNLKVDKEPVIKELSVEVYKKIQELKPKKAK